MNKKHVILSGLISVVIGGLVGFFSYSQVFARYDAVVTSCVMMNQAVDHQLLTTEQVKQLGVLTGKSLKLSHGTVLNKLSLSDSQVANASEGSVCSQFLVGVNQSN